MFFKKNKKMKWWLSFGTVASIATVAATVVSCSATSTNDATSKTTTSNNSPSKTKDQPDKKTNSNDNSFSPISNLALNSKILDSPLQVLNDKNQITTVDLPTGEQEEFVLAKYYYSGQINDSTNGIGYISNNPNNTNSDTNNYSDVIMMAPSDSLVLVFNQSLKYNLKQMQAYINTLYFNDSSIGSWASNQKGVIDGGYIKFDNTEMANSYYGSQTNHILNPPAFGTWLAQIAPSYKNNSSGWQALLNYYGFIENSKGQYVLNSSSTNAASTAFYPLGVIPQNLWTIKQVASNAFAFTYNANINQIPSITYANISQILTSVNGNTSINTQNPQITPLTPALSLGTPYEWNHYMTGSYNQMQGQKLSKFTIEPTSGLAININPDLIINTNLTNGVLNANISSYIKYLTLDTIPSTSNLIIIQNPISNELEQYSSL